MSFDSLRHPVPWAARARTRTRRGVGVERVLARPELLGLLATAAVLNLWNLGINGWANTYYSAAVRSMSSSWHDFVFASLDRSGLMTVDKPPLALWVEALSARIFGFHPLSILVPQALMGIVAVGLLYDLVARRFGRIAGAFAGLALATTPITVAVARHNNPDELLILCSVAALWCAVRGLERGRARWLVLSGVCIGLGFEAKMGVALLIVPGIAAAWLWAAPGRPLERIRALLAGGAAMVAVGGAWPLLVTLTPAADRPWISGTSDNSIWSLIFGYNGLGRVAGQSGGPGGGGGFGGTLFGGPTGVFRLLQTGLGDQAGWLLGLSLVAAIALLALTRLRRRDPRTGWLLAIGGAFLTSAVVFSFARGIFHPYYVSFIAPFAAALLGAGVGLMLDRGRTGRVIAPLAIAGGAVTELVVLGETGGSLTWAVPLAVVVGSCTAIVLAGGLRARTRLVVLAVAMAALLAAPATWAAETLGHATSSTFPTGGPASASVGAPGGFGSPGGRTGGPRGLSGRPPGGGAVGRGGPAGGFGGGAAAPGGGFGADSTDLAAVIRYADSHGGGTIGVESQSTAAALILQMHANIAGLGGFSGRESSVTVAWLAAEVRSGHLRWIVVDGTQAGDLPGDTRTGSQTAFDAVARACRAVDLSPGNGTVSLYDCAGRSAAILAVDRS
jgi:4-amino-4-deoxy-L-arabinose transferase-like glycosyltransferase